MNGRGVAQCFTGGRNLPRGIILDDGIICTSNDHKPQNQTIKQLLMSKRTNLFILFAFHKIYLNKQLKTMFEQELSLSDSVTSWCSVVAMHMYSIYFVICDDFHHSDFGPVL